MKRLALIALGFTLTGCDSGKKNDGTTGTPGVAADSPTLPNPTGRWEKRTEPATTSYMYWRYEFKKDHSFVRETGTSNGVTGSKISGSWSVTGEVAPQYSGKSLGDDIKRAAGIAIPPPPGTIVLKYSVLSKQDIPVGATLVDERGPAMQPEKRSFDLEEHYFVKVDKGGDKPYLVIGNQRFAGMTP